MNIKEYQESQRPEEARIKQYERACSQVYPGFLSSHDVCRLFSNEPYSTWGQTPGQTARRLVETLNLPLMETSQGRYMVTHTVQGLEVPNE